MQNQLKKVLDLSKKTGDRVIVFNQDNSDDTYVVMSLNDYEKLAVGKNEVRGLTEDELLDKINRDIAIWKSDQEFKENKQKIINNISFDNIEDDFSENYSESDHLDQFFSNIKEKKEKSTWTIPKERKESAEEIIEEDRQYLEEIQN